MSRTPFPSLLFPSLLFSWRSLSLAPSFGRARARSFYFAWRRPPFGGSRSESASSCVWPRGRRVTKFMKAWAKFDWTVELDGGETE